MVLAWMAAELVKGRRSVNGGLTARAQARMLLALQTISLLAPVFRGMYLSPVSWEQAQ